MKLTKETYARKRTDWRKAECRALDEEEVAWRLFQSARLKAKRRGLEFDLRFNDVLRQVKRGKCPVTGVPFDNRSKPLQGPDLPFRASLDRVDNTRGYFADNIMVVSKIFNHAKYNWNSDDVLKMARGIVEAYNAKKG
jgi:hypothetical protein